MTELLLMEPDRERARHMERVLNGADYHCTVCEHIAEGLARLQTGVRTMTVLNARMPWKESAPFLRALESKGLPVLFVTAETNTEAHLRAMYASDCDVISADASDEELLQAVAHLLAVSPATLTLGGLSLRMDTRSVRIGTREESLTGQEFALLQALMQSPNATLSRQELLERAWGFEGVGITRTVDVHVQRLRRKLGEGFIETIYKMGYRLRVA